MNLCFPVLTIFVITAKDSVVSSARVVPQHEGNAAFLAVEYNRWKSNFPLFLSVLI